MSDLEGAALHKAIASIKGAGSKSIVFKGAAAKGISAKGIGVGLSLGTWAPVFMGVIGAMIAYAFWKNHKETFNQSETDAEIKDALD